jgi:heat shock protein HtpX
MYEQIAANKRNSVFLVVIFICLILVLSEVLGLYTGMGYSALFFAGILCIVMALVSYFTGDKIILGISRAKQIEKKDNPQLYNVIEELCVSGGLPLPKIYIIDDTAPNAFATGRNPRTASVAITTGLLQKLKRDQLQGVMAHELSHIKNYDILFCTLVTVLVGVVALLSDVMRRSIFYGGRSRSSNRSSKGGGDVIILVITLFLAILAPIFAQILKFAVSRQREYLADASSVELTRYPEGLAQALEIIANDKEVLEVANRATQHLYIVNPIKPFESRAQNNIFSTHPPIEERIKRLRNMASVR